MIQALKSRIVILFLLFLVSIAFAKKKKRIASIEGDRHFRKYEYLTALPFLEAAIKEDSNRAKTLFQLGACYSQRYHKSKAIYLLERAYAINPKVDKNFFYWYGKALQNESQFDKAKGNYTKYIESAKKKRNSLYILAQKHLIECEHGILVENQPQEYMVKIIGAEVNSIHSEHRPVISPNDSILYFTSTRQSKFLHDLNVGFIENSYSTSKQANGNWGKAEWADSLLHLTLNDAVCQLFANGNKMLIFHTSNNGDIYFSNKKNGKWTKPHRFPHINSNAFESDAFLTEDGDKVYFASNNGTKYGDLDLFMSESTGDSTWSDPINLGPSINTTEHEGSPFLSSDGKTLYFSSKGHSSIGGYDIFKSVYDSLSKKWLEPQNIGMPINTPGDDMFFSILKDGNKGYYASYRESGFGESDIYEIYRMAKVPYESTIYSKDSILAFGGLTLILAKYKDNIEIEKREINIKENSFSDSIQVGYEYKAYIVHESDTVHRETFKAEFAPANNQPLVKNFYIDLNEEQMMGRAYYKGMRVPDLNATYIYYKFNSSKIDSKADKKIENVADLLKKFPFLKITITSYSNDLRTDQKSLNLSEERAENVVEKLETIGISENRLKSRFQGIAIRKVKGQTPVQKKFNRRTEIKLTR